MAFALIPAIVQAQGAPTPLIPPSVSFPPAMNGPATIEQTPLPPPPGLTSPTQPEPPPSAAAAPQTPQPPAQAQAEPGAPPQWPNVWLPQPAAALLVLDKVDAVSRDLTVKVGQTVSYRSLSIQVQACVVHPPDQPANAAAYLVITDAHKDEPGFRGWSLANEPWVSMLQNPVYGVRVVGCRG